MTDTPDGRRLTVFRVGDEYLFAHYFERESLFASLREYYVRDAYRFEVPAAAFEAVREDLVAADYDPVVVCDLEPYCVVTEVYAPHADILRDSVANWERRGHRFFLLPDEAAVERAVMQGATPIEETEFVLGL